jgi:hypothetical protein
LLPSAEPVKAIDRRVFSFPKVIAFTLFSPFGEYVYEAYNDTNQKIKIKLNKS